MTEYCLLLGVKRTVQYISDENSEGPASYTLFETMSFTLLTPFNFYPDVASHSQLSDVKNRKEIWRH